MRHNTASTERQYLLSQRAYDTYRDPFRKAEWRKPLFMWAREVGLGGDVPHTDEAMERYNKWLLEKEIPTLDVYVAPGEEVLSVEIDPARVAAWRGAFPALDDRRMGSSLHGLREA